MNFFPKLLLLLIIALSTTILFAFLAPHCCVIAESQGQNILVFESDQSFSSNAGSTIEYNIYIENRGKSIASYTLTADSNRDYYVEVWQDTDQIGSGNIQLIPPQKSIIILDPDEVATLIVRVFIPLDAVNGSVDNTIITATEIESGASDSVSITTFVNYDLPYPSNWIQFGSDPLFPIPPPEKIDVKALYYTNNGTEVFFRIAGVGEPDTTSFRYSVYLDTVSGGQQMEDYNYDYFLSSDGILYQWDGTYWIDLGYSVYWQIDGSAIVLWTNLGNLSMDIQEIHILGCATTKSWVLKDKVGPFHILKDNIAEIPFFLIPLLFFAVFLQLRGKSKNT